MGSRDAKSATRPVAVANSVTPTNNISINTLNEQAEKDKNLRNETNLNWDEINKLDRQSSEMIKGFLDKHGYPSVKKYGRDASFNAFLLVQHSYHDLPLMKRYLTLMKKENEPESRQDMAFLTDRILMMSNRRQIYGTQFVEDKNGKYVPYSIMKPRSVNERRASIGLEPIEEYAKYFN